VVILTIHDSPAYRADAANVGASAYVLKEEMQTQLVPTLEGLLANGS
jgi:DNA-binding NarL/FixJ family response regulator